jgi:hypothetical protein
MRGSPRANAMSPDKQSLEALIRTGLVDGSYRVERLIGEGGNEYFETSTHLHRIGG